MNDETRHVIAHVARPSYPALELDCLANFQNKRHTLSRTLARVRLPTPRTQLSGHVARGRDGPHPRRTGISLWFFYQIPFIFQPSLAKATTQHNRATLHDTFFVEHYTKISQFCAQFRKFAFFRGKGRPVLHSILLPRSEISHEIMALCSEFQRSCRTCGR